ncbi:MAG TPA: AbrB/MazE/SpoVT family DNA-binding domain-containing protein [Candidatus Nanoarchaeia archaeon]|nr:AbrB/MazE/SpoVT family DNA-binding domain-containing protein [Candidatus Nanoarchaeia archaeon]
MIEVESQLKEWGNSFGVLVPKGVTLKEGLKEGDKVLLFLTKKTDALKKTFGTAKFRKTTEEILKQGDKDSWDE